MLMIFYNIIKKILHFNKDIFKINTLLIYKGMKTMLELKNVSFKVDDEGKEKTISFYVNI